MYMLPASSVWLAFNHQDGYVTSHPMTSNGPIIEGIIKEFLMWNGEKIRTVDAFIHHSCFIWNGEKIRTVDAFIHHSYL